MLSREIIGLEGLLELKETTSVFFSQATRSEIIVYIELKVKLMNPGDSFLTVYE